MKYLLTLFLIIWAACPAEADMVPTKKIVNVINANALVPPSKEKLARFLSLKKVNSSEINDFLQSFDPWANWISKDDLKRQQRPNTHKGSIGMDVVQNHAGEFVCIPYPDGPAARAGIMEGDILMNMYTMADVMQLSGPIGSTATFSIKRNFKSHVYKVMREKVTPPHVQFFQHQGFARIRIWRFDKSTPSLFDAKLLQANIQPLVIDVRGNSGGEFLSALACAAKLIPEGKDIGISLMRTSTQSLQLESKKRKTAELGIYADIGPIFIWQDSLTASSAEAFIVALVDNGRAKSIGTTTFGKAKAQSVYIVNGNRLLLTTEDLLTPYGQSWDDIGLEPQISTNSSLSNLIKQTAKLLIPYD